MRKLPGPFVKRMNSWLASGQYKSRIVHVLVGDPEKVGTLEVEWRFVLDDVPWQVMQYLKSASERELSLRFSTDIVRMVRQKEGL